MMTTKTIALAIALALGVSTFALAESPYPTGACPSGYVGKGNFCEAIR